MASYGTTAAIKDALARRVARLSVKQTTNEWYIKRVTSEISITLVERVELATEMLKSVIISNLGVPVGRDATGKVVERSKPGEFPRAETTLLMKTIFSDYEHTDNETSFSGFVGTPLDYGLWLETQMDRSFLERSLEDKRKNIEEILTAKMNT